jgi:hypothetical protein
MKIQSIAILFLILTFLAGFIVLLNNGIKYDTSISNGCPNLLVRKGNKLSLLDSNAKYSPGINPMIFDNLDSYKDYLEKQKQKGLSCPVLYIQEENDVQGRDVYKMYSDPLERDNGLMTMNLVTNMEENMENVVDLSGSQGPFNTNQYPSFDPQGLYIGKFTSLDAVHDSTITQNENNISDNAMDSNWGGVLKTQQVVSTGKYVENEVNKITYPKMYPKN